MKRAIITSKSKNEILKKTAGTLKAGGLVVFPSDTVYGLLVDALNEKAVRKLLKFKNRPAGKAISVFVDWKLLDKVVKTNQEVREKLEELLPGPFTIILPSKNKVSPLLESEGGTLGVRIANAPMISELLRSYKKPVTATSANLSGRPPHYSVDSLLNTLSDKKRSLIDLIVDAGKLPRKKPSTVVDFTQSTLKILRRGDLNISSKSIFISKSENETKKIAREIVGKFSSKKPASIIIKGDLGAGKTVFVKGIGEFLGVRNIISPTYVIEYEYALNNQKFKKLIHLDLYNISDPEELTYLGIQDYIKENNLLCFEWGDKAGDILGLLKKTEMVTVSIRHINKTTRKISVSQ